MKNTFGNNVSLTIFGESHGKALGFVLDGIAPGIPVDEENIKHVLSLRRPVGAISTSRSEEDDFVIQSGVYNGFTTGSPICITIPNNDVKSQDYSNIAKLARPSHGDYTAHCKYNGFEDYRGGGHFSGRITAALVAAGGILIPALNKKGIKIGTHIKSCADINDRDFQNLENDIKKLSDLPFAVLDDDISQAMQERILEVKKSGDSIGGVLETAVIGLDAGIGEPWFDSMEGMLAHCLFSVPGVKGVSFGAGFHISKMLGSQANDSFFMNGNKVCTKTNHSGGINGGITNGMPVLINTAFRPTPTIGLEQETIDYVNLNNATLSAKGRHDPCIVHRARIVVDSAVALVICDLLATKYGTDWLAK